MPGLQKALGTVVRRERRAQGLTMKDLASRAFISVVYLGEIERGKKYPSPAVLEEVAGALSLPVGDLLELVAYELRGEALTPRVIGFARPASTEKPPIHVTRVVNLVGAVSAGSSAPHLCVVPAAVA